MTSNWEQLVGKFKSLESPTERAKFIDSAPNTSEAAGTVWHSLLLSLFDDPELYCDEVCQEAIDAISKISPRDPKTCALLQQRDADPSLPQTQAVSKYLRAYDSLPNLSEKMSKGDWVIIYCQEVLS